MISFWLPDPMTIEDVHSLRRVYAECWTDRVENIPLALALLCALYVRAAYGEFVARQTYLSTLPDALLVERYSAPGLYGTERRALDFEMRRRYGSVDEAIMRGRIPHIGGTS